MSDSEGGGGGVSLGTVLAVLFVTLKLADIGWFASASWWWIVAFAFGPLVVLVPIMIAYAIAVMIDGIKAKRRLNNAMKE